MTVNARDCTRAPSRVRPSLGVSRTYQKTRLFNALSVEDNLYLARDRQGAPAPVDAALVPRRRVVRHSAIGRRTCLARSNADTKVADLSHGERRQLEIGMALASEPQIMLLDEPASGLSRGERERLVELLHSLAPELTLLLIEHDMDVAPPRRRAGGGDG